MSVSVRRVTRALGLVFCSMATVYAQDEVVLPVPSTDPMEVLPTPTVLDSAEMSLSRAVELAILLSPEVFLARQSVDSARGRVQAARGNFDSIVRVGPGFSYTINELRPFMRQRESDKREQLRIVAKTFAEINKQLGDILAGISSVPPRCPPELDNIVVNSTILDRPDPAITDIQGVSQDQAPIDFLSGFNFDLDDVCRPATDFSLSDNDFIEFWTRVARRVTSIELDSIIDDFTQFPRETIAHGYEISEAVTTRAALGLVRLGDEPLEEIRKNLFIDTAYFKAFRNGISVTGEFRLTSEEQNFKDKPLDPTFGGLGFETPFRNFASLTFDVPLGKGRGRVSSQAPERAAELTLAAQQDLLRHVMTSEAFRTMLAYINLMAAQESLVLLEESAERQQQFVAITERLIGDGDLPRVELDRAQARQATVESAVNEGRLNVLSSRLSLAQTIGIASGTLEGAPIATDTLPQVAQGAGGGALRAWIAEGVSQRRDLKALTSLQRSSRVLSSAARADLKRRIDFTGTVGLSPLYFSPLFRFLPDEIDPLESYDFDGDGILGPDAPEPRDSPVHFYSPTGFWRAVRTEWQPFFTVSVTFEVPFGNNVAKGQALQAESSFRQSEIERWDLGRVIEENIVEVARAVEHARSAVERRRDAITFFEEALEGTRQQFEAGDVPLIDVLTTEEDLTREKLSLTRELSFFYSLLARLEFERASLLEFASEGTRSERVRFESSGWVAR